MVSYLSQLSLETYDEINFNKYRCLKLNESFTFFSWSVEKNEQVQDVVHVILS